MSDVSAEMMGEFRIAYPVEYINMMFMGMLAMNAQHKAGLTHDEVAMLALRMAGNTLHEMTQYFQLTSREEARRLEYSASVKLVAWRYPNSAGMK